MPNGGEIHLMIQMRQMIQKQPPHQPEVQRIPHLQSQGIPKIYTPLSQNRQKFQQFLLVGDDAESAEPGGTVDTPPVIQDDIEQTPTMPDSTEPHIPPSDSQEDTTVTEPDNEPSIPTEETEQDTPQETVPVTESAPSNPEDIEQNTPPEETSGNDTPSELDTREPSSPVGEIPSNPHSQNIGDSPTSKNDASTSSHTENSGNTGSGEPVANASLIAEETILDTATESESGSESIALNPTVLEHNDDGNWEKVNRIASIILIISLIELGILLVIFTYWLKRVRK